ncbi:putative membrane protein YhiD involved in acid resistance [Weissella beninensis]|uniref:Lipoprotein n=1 Tax=Periweissella beninensis TaxID=504936 RepID=A0ABT0VJW2_9LACO|nr:hypothetical protein [Periweissella beninensis]MBM7544942.1 putative membrane protein YhiD involved in acid resistance [Periweissella beninensis]MCM2437184.1 hypothetical protein [Periweissella beninensis]
MKKISGIATIVILVVLAVGGGVWTINKHNSQKTYQTELKAAQKNVNEKKYTQAIANLNDAKKASKGTEQKTVVTYLKQIKLFITAENTTDNNKAKNNYQKVKNIENGYTILRKRAINALDKLIDATTSSKVSSVVSSAKSSVSSSITSSSKKTSSANTTSDTSTTESSKAKTSSKKATSKVTKDQNEGVGSADAAKKYSKDAMGKTITDNEVSQARTTLKKANIDEGAFPDSDIKKFIKEASKANSGGLVQVVKDYLKSGE